MDGFETTPRLRATHSIETLPILALIPDITPQVQERCTAPG